MWPNHPKTEPVRPLPPGSTIGILGGGQLGRMLAQAAAELGFRCHIYCAEDEAPACDVAAAATRAAYDDEAALNAFGRAVDVVTAEFENVPANSAEVLASLVPVRPGALALAVAQDRLVEKEFAQRLWIKTARFTGVQTHEALAAALAFTGTPAILKTRRLGYDGKGQAPIAKAEEAGAGFAALGGRDLILEQRIKFEREISVILARSVTGAIAVYDIPVNVHEQGILVKSTVPANLPPDLEAEAVTAARRLAEALDYVGVIAVEFFIAQKPDGTRTLLFNEFAPRVHNSGHWTQDACAVSQFEQHIRAVAGWPLGDPMRHANAVMENLIGADAARWAEFAAEPGARLHLYGKKEIRPGRKMGHVTRLSPLHD
jgi:5-(carboxyamino)imidazole ribonucleotide synthase